MLKPEESMPPGTSPYRHVGLQFDAGASCTVHDFYEQFAGSLPQMMYVTQGQYALTEIETFSAEQVIWVHNKLTQKRVVAHTNKNIRISIPLDFPLKFRVVEDRNRVGPDDYLKNLVTGNLPILIQFSPTPLKFTTVSGTTENVSFFGNMTVSEVYDEIYFIGNCFNMGWLSPKVIVVPLYLQDVLVTRVVGLKEGEKMWDELKQYIKGEVRNVSLAGLKGNQEIAVYTGDTDKDHVYEYIRCSFDKIHSRSSRKDVASAIYSSPNDYQPFSSVSVKRRDHVPPLPPNHPEPEPKVDSDAVPKLPPRRKTSASSPTEKTAKAQYTNSQRQTFDINQLTIDELGQSLKMLRLDKYVKPFKSKGIDGRTLTGLVTEDLESVKTEFKMSSVDAVKLKNFALTGHIPR